MAMSLDYLCINQMNPGKMIREIKVQDLNTGQFIAEKVNEIRAAVGDGMAINALSGGVDSSVVTMIGHMALGERLRTA